LPQALELQLEHRRYGELRRLLRLADALPKGAAQADQPGEPDEPDEVLEP
jgi:general secretion pathway protein J